MVQWQWWQERVRNIRSLLSALLLLPSPRQSCNAHLVIHRHYVSSTPGLHSVLMQSHFRGRRCRVQASKRSPADYSAQICIQFNGVRPLVMLHHTRFTNTQIAVVHTVTLLHSPAGSTELQCTFANSPKLLFVHPRITFCPFAIPL